MTKSESAKKCDQNKASVMTSKVNMNMGVVFCFPTNSAGQDRRRLSTNNCVQSYKQLL